MNGESHNNICVKYNLPTIFTISCVIVFFIVALDSDGYLVDTRTEIIVGRQISSPTEVKHTVEQFIKHKLSSSFICIQWEYDFGYLDLITREELFRLPNLEENLNFVVTRLKEILSEKKLSKMNYKGLTGQ